MALVRVIDFETTGPDPTTAQVCEVGICDVVVAARDIGPAKAWLCAVDRMPPEARAVHHISLADLAGQPPFDPARMFKPHQGDCVAVAAHNAAFETGFFTSPLPVICTYKAALRAWPEAPSHGNGALRYWLEDAGLICPNHERALPAHRAGPDAYVTAHIFVALLNAGITGKDMVAWTREPALLPRCPIGKFRGKPWPEVEGGFLSWMLRQADMDEDLKWNAQRELNRRAGVASG